MEHFNKLTPAEAERLSLLLEEMGEAIQIIGKIKRHGYKSYHPKDERRTPNSELLEKELGHVLHAIHRLCDKGDLSMDTIHLHQKLKSKSVLRYLHHQE